MRRLLFLIWLLLWGMPAAAQQPVPVVRIVTTDFVLPAKFERMAEWAQAAGLELDWVVAGGAAAQPPVEDAAMLILDGPRPSDMASIERLVGDTATLTLPWIKVGGGPPGFGNLPPGTARRLIGYYAAGGAPNLRNFVVAAGRALAGSPVDDLPAPVPLPETGIYHPDAETVFATPDTYRAWLAARGAAARPIVAIAISDGLLRDMQTDVVDAIARSVEARGLAPALFWFDASDAEGLTSLLAPLGAQALVNMTHMQNGDARKAEFAALDMPVLQAIGDRSNSVAEWRNATSGVPAYSAAVTLSVPESWGISDPIVVSAVEGGRAVPIPEQVELLTGKLARLVALRTKPAQDKHIALFFWNHPVGEENFSASNLNVPRSLEKLTRDLADAGYRVTPADEAQLIDAAQAMMGGLYRPETLDDLLARGLAARLPVADYRAWLATLPEARRAELSAAMANPEQHWAVRGGDFIIPRLQLGNLVILPQPPRGGDPTRSYHDLTNVPDPLYLATYLWVRSHAQADAIVHFGTHGTQEWTPGKDRGLWAGDYPMLLVGDLPVFYPYIQDNVAEAIQARRRGRAVTVSHQTPAFAPSGLYDELRDLHSRIHEYAQVEEGAVRDRLAGEIREAAFAAHLADDIGWDRAAAGRDFAGFYTALHDHLHQLARSAIPLGLHVFGEPAAPEHRLTTVMQQLGPDYLRALGIDPVEAFAEDFSQLRESLPYTTLARYLRDGEPTNGIADAGLRAQVERAMALERNLAEPGETEALLQGLAGGFVLPGAGGDPVRNPEVASGRNLFAFEAEKVPAQAAYEEGGKAFDQLLAAYAGRHEGALPEKLAFSMFAGETIRTLGVTEGQILHALGLRPVWGRGGRVETLEIIPIAELGRPRIDVVVQASSVYRDQFDGFMRLLGDAIDRLAALDEPGLARNARDTEARLVARGIAPERARELARLRIFSNAPGEYGSGLPDRIAKDADWESEDELAATFLDRLQYAYGARDWGLKLEGTNLFAEQLRGVDAAVLSRSTNVHGLLSTDHPFEYLGGLSLAVRSVSGEAPDLFVTDLRQSGMPRTTTAAAFLSDELRARYLNPHWIGEMQKQGYAGATEMLDVVNNLWGWQVTDPATVRADQWQAMHDTYVRDTRNLGLDRFFEAVHPDAQLQMIDRMREAIARGYWQADAATRAELDARRDALARLAGEASAVAPNGGFGLSPAAVSNAGTLSGAAAPPPPAPAQADPHVSPAQSSAPPRGFVLKKQELSQPQATTLRGTAPAAAAILFLLLLGALLEWRARRNSLEKVADARA
ncbi:cobaltochelatase subunit CobN [Sphingosinithalassobacter sp. CS137]|uniref:cobaltochelatase subunit CobN n=1 Tax=Sphingosinithalassobacter sp. CS137 TaxID=2762748 RepID=UPI00165D3E4D|nr:cobaltochelatase subunit CobN [Sphingosinithalassobacter sp. CS137]